LSVIVVYLLQHGGLCDVIFPCLKAYCLFYVHVNSQPHKVSQAAWQGPRAKSMGKGEF